MAQASAALRIIPLGLVLLGLAALLASVLMPVSPRKGWARLSASLLVAAAFALGSSAQMVQEHRPWPGIVGLAIGLFLVYVGFRKQKRDPHGRTPTASMF